MRNSTNIKVSFFFSIISILSFPVPMVSSGERSIDGCSVEKEPSCVLAFFQIGKKEGNGYSIQPSAFVVWLPITTICDIKPATRSSTQTGGRSWQVPLGRRDGLVSRASDTANLPAFNDPMTVQIQKFANKGLNVQDLVILVGGHTIGTAACAVFSYRLYNFNNTNAPDPDINQAFLPQLRALCPNGGNALRRVGLDTGSVNSFGNSFYDNLRNGLGVIESDAKLWSDRRTQRFVQGLSGQRSGFRFNAQFGRAMVKMGNIEVKTGRQGEIRRVCTATN
ncbi:peroxidase N1-like protein [Tanacetum coccineum]